MWRPLQPTTCPPDRSTPWPTRRHAATLPRPPQATRPSRPPELERGHTAALRRLPDHLPQPRQTIRPSRYLHAAERTPHQIRRLRRLPDRPLRALRDPYSAPRNRPLGHGHRGRVGGTQAPGGTRGVGAHGRQRPTINNQSLRTSMERGWGTWHTLGARHPYIGSS